MQKFKPFEYMLINLANNFVEVFSKISYANNTG